MLYTKLKIFLFNVNCYYHIYIATSIHCYQCYGTNSSAKYLFQCNEWLDSDTLLEPESCDTVYGAKYCVKQVGRYEGKMYLDRMTPVFGFWFLTTE